MLLAQAVEDYAELYLVDDIIWAAMMRDLELGASGKYTAHHGMSELMI